MEFVHFQGGGEANLGGMHELFARHGAGALYQGTTLVGPHMPNERSGL
jgi:hypothetical protein